MKRLRPYALVAFVLALMLGIPCRGGAASTVELMRTPGDGIQPQAVADEQGRVHLVYLKGDPGAGDIFYVRREPGRKEFPKPIRVNSQSGTAVAAGTIRGAQLAVGRNGRVHVVWNGPHQKGSQESAPLFYARLNDAGSAFEAQRNLMTWTGGLDGGGSVAADLKGNVYVTWHGSDGTEMAGGKPHSGEGARAVFVARSRDDGQTFSREVQANPDPTGACGCCGMKAFADREGNVYALYRSATQVLNRDMMLLALAEGTARFNGTTVQAWRVGTCPMSSASLTQAGGTVLAAWETNGQVYFGKIVSGTARISLPVAPPGTGKRKHPAVAGNAAGETLLAWAEGTGWQKGGQLAWQLFDRDGRAVGATGRADGLPVWSLPTAFADGDGRFVIVY